MLKPKKKITKKELKHDPMLDAMEQAKEFFEENSQQIYYAIGGLVVVILLVWGWMSSQTSTNNEAMLANTKAVIAATAGVDENVKMELENVVNEYGNNKFITQSSYELGVQMIKDGDFAGARNIFEGLASSSDQLTRIAGKLKLAYVSEKEADYASAARLYNEVAALDAGKNSEYAKVQAGYAFLAAGDAAAAAQIAEEVLSEEPKGKYKEAVEYLAGRAVEK